MNALVGELHHLIRIDVDADLLASGVKAWAGGIVNLRLILLRISTNVIMPEERSRLRLRRSVLCGGHDS